MGQNPADVELSLARQWGHRHGAAPGGSPAPGVVLRAPGAAPCPMCDLQQGVGQGVGRSPAVLFSAEPGEQDLISTSWFCRLCGVISQDFLCSS